MYLTSAVRTFSVLELGYSPEGLTGSTVHTLILSLVDVALIVKLFKNLLNLLLVVRIGRTDKSVI